MITHSIKCASYTTLALEKRGHIPRRCDCGAVASALLDALLPYVEWHQACHDEDCPGDDTCSCSGKPINDAMNQALAEAEAECKVEDPFEQWHDSQTTRPEHSVEHEDPEEAAELLHPEL